MKIVINFSTNGIPHDRSVLEFSAILLNDNNEKIGAVDRYYYLSPEEDWDSDAQKKHHLNARKIYKFRRGTMYPRLFVLDTYILGLLKEAKEIVAHNMEFFKKFIPGELKGKNLFCTMEEEFLINGIAYGVNGEKKAPSLDEALAHYKIEPSSLPCERGEAPFDVRATFEIYKKIKSTSLRERDAMSALFESA